MRPLERRFAAYLLILIYENPGQTKSFIVNYEPKFIRTKHDRLEELEAGGFIRVERDPDNHKNRLLYTTEVGDIVAEAMIKAKGLLEPNDCEPDDY